MVKKILLSGIKVIVTLLLFALLFRPDLFGLPKDFWGEHITLQGLVQELGNIETHNLLLWLSVAVVVRLLGIFCGILRWRLLLKGQGLNIPFFYTVRSWFIGRAIGIFLPGTVGLDGYRLYDAIRFTGDIARNITVIVIEKLTGFIALTLLVFITFPLGYHLVHFNIPMLLLTMSLLFIVVCFSLWMLFYPHVLQVLIAIFPIPIGMRKKLEKVAQAIVTYGTQRRLILGAIVLGLLVHTAICFMFVGVMAALRAENTKISDVLFTSPLMIWGTVLGPSVGGEGIREIVFTSILGATSGTTKAFLIGHLGWWVGDVVPFLLGLLMFLSQRIPSKQQIKHEIHRASMEKPLTPVETLTPKQIHEYRMKILSVLICGLLAGLWSGGVCGVLESLWVISTIKNLPEFGLFSWSMFWYGIVFACLGVGIAGGMILLFLQKNSFPPLRISASVVVGICVLVGVSVIGSFRYYRDVLGEHSLSLLDYGWCGGVALGVAGAFAALVYLILRVLKFTGTGKAVVSLGLYLLVFLTTWVFANLNEEKHDISKISSQPTSISMPHVIFIAADALRADVLRLYNPDSTTHTPNLDKFAEDAILFTNAFAQASWTKPSFATMFTGLYPTTHGAISKTAVLPENVITLAEILQSAGYFTKGVANNPNITALFRFDQGFHDYVELRPTLHFGASYSASKLSFYEVLRRARQIIQGKLWRGHLSVTDFYQPADVVTNSALEWLDEFIANHSQPIFLFLHYMETHDPFMDHHNPGIGYARVRLPNPDPEKYRLPMWNAYLQEVEYLDTYLGLLFQGLRERGLYDNALIIFVSDHGEEFYDHRGWWHGQTLYDEVLRIPLIIKLPGNVSAQQEDAQFARHIDLLPTVLTLLKLPVPEGLPGHALCNLEGHLTQRNVNYVYAENNFEGNILQSARTSDAKVILANPDNSRNLAPIEFYDIMTDPKEQTNLAGKGDSREANLRDLIGQMLEYLNKHAAEPVLHDLLPSDLKEQMRSIGYF